MSDAAVSAVVELEAAIVCAKEAAAAAQKDFDAASERLQHVQRGHQLSNSAFNRLIGEVRQAESSISEAYLSHLVGGAKKPDVGVLVKLRGERDLAETALKYLRRQFPIARSAALEAEAVLCDRQASIQYAESQVERERGLHAFESIADDFGPGASLEIRGSKWQKLQEIGDSLIQASRTLRLQAEQVLAEIFPEEE